MPKISAAKTPLEGWRAEIWVSTLNRWFTMTGCPFFPNPDDAIAWGKDQLAGHPAHADE
jgi:hypothetical protein